MPLLGRPHLSLAQVLCMAFSCASIFHSNVMAHSPARLCKAFVRSYLRPRVLVRRSSTQSRRLVFRPTQPTTVFSLSSSTQADSQQDTSVFIDEDQVYQELVTLSSEVLRHDQLYYELGIPEVSDDEYDGLCQRERDVCQKFPHLARRWIESGGSTRESRVGSLSAGTLDEVTKRTHLKPMLSLDNVHTTEELLKWLDRVRKKLADNESLTLITEPKLDGLSISLRYDENGKLIWAATRGDGTRGLDVTAAALQYIAHLPSALKMESFNAAVEVRGEVILPKSSFQRLQTGNQSTISNARNAAAGMLLRKQPADSTLPSVDLQFYAYDVVMSEAQGALNDGLDLRQWLKQQGFKIPLPSTQTYLVNEGEQWSECDIRPMLSYASSLQEHRRGTKQTETPDYSWDDYDMDGCVHKVVQSAIRDSLGATSRAPRWAIAHKLPATMAITRLTNISTQVGRTGALTPVADLEPVSLDGVIVQRATLHNFQHLQKLLGSKERIRKNTLVWIRRSGDVIPQVMGLVNKTDQIETLDHGASMADNQFISLRAPRCCPACGSETLFEPIQNSSNSTLSGQVVRCGGPALLCSPRATLAVTHAFSRDALDITGLSEARIKQLMDNGFVKFPCDLFKLVKDDSKLEQLATLDGWGPLSVKKLKSVADRVAVDGVTLARFIYALNIRSVGAQTASLLALAYGSVDTFWREVDEAATCADEEQTFPLLRHERNETKGIGPGLLSSLLSFAKDSQMTTAGKELSELVPVLGAATPVGPPESTLTRPWSGMSVVFTGALPNLSRPEAEKLAKDVLGAKSTPKTISKSTDWVVIGDKSGKKAKQAEDLGVRTLGHQDFLALIRETLR